MSFNKSFVNNSALSEVESVCKLHNIPYKKKRIFTFKNSIKPIYINILETDKFVLVEKAIVSSDCDVNDRKISEIVSKDKLKKYEDKKLFVVTILFKYDGDKAYVKKINLFDYVNNHQPVA